MWHSSGVGAPGVPPQGVPLPLSLTKQAGNVVAVRSQPACSQNVSAVLQPLLVLSKHPGKVFVTSQPACSHPVVTTGQLTTATGSWSVAIPPTESVSLVWLNDVPRVSGYLALTAMNPFTMSWSRTVYVAPVSVVMSGNDVDAPSRLRKNGP